MKEPVTTMKILLAVLILALFNSAVWAGPGQKESLYLGKPFSYWFKVIQDRDPDKIEDAFDAIVQFGPEASNAVPELTRIVAEPFAPIQLGSDSLTQILSKVHNIYLRGGAVDSLGAIGEAASPSTSQLIEWAFAVRVLPPEVSSPESDRLFIDLVAIDVLERMRVAGAVGQFGIGAAKPVQALLESPDLERRKFSVAILNSGTLPIAAEFLKSDNCEQRGVGLTLMADMWPVISVDHLNALRAVAKCSAAPVDARSRRPGPIGRR